MGITALHSVSCQLDATDTHDESGEVLRAPDTVRFLFTLPRFPCNNFSNIDIIFDKSGRNVFALVQDTLSNLPPEVEQANDDESQGISRANEILSFAHKASIYLEVPLLAAIQDVQAAAVRILLGDFHMIDHFHFCFLAFFLYDNRVFEHINSRFFSFDGETRKSDVTRNSYDDSMGHTLAYLLTQHLPQNSSSSVSVDFKELPKAEISPYQNSGKGKEPEEYQRQNDDILATILGMRISVLHTWPISEVLSFTCLEEYNSIMIGLLSITCVKWTTEMVWKKAFDAEKRWKVSRVCRASKQSTATAIALVRISYRRCIVGLHWFQYILGGLLGYYMRHIHEGILPPFLAKIGKSASVNELVKSHELMLYEVSEVMKVEQAHISNMLSLGHRATTAFNKALEMLDTLNVELNEDAPRIPRESSKPQIELFFERAEAAYRNLRLSVKAISSNLEVEAASSRIGRSSSIVGLNSLRAVFGDTRNWM